MVLGLSWETGEILWKTAAQSNVDSTVGMQTWFSADRLVALTMYEHLFALDRRSGRLLALPEWWPTRNS